MSVDFPGTHGEEARTCEAWLESFHRGDHDAIERCYREHHAAVAAALARMLPQVDAESASHDVFYRLLTNPKLRASFQGGHIGAWLTRVAKHCAIDHLRHLHREHGDPRRPLEAEPALDERVGEDAFEAKRLIEKFRLERLPPQWVGVFETRFLRGLSQREAARELAIHRTTLVYREHRIRALLRRFLLGEGP